MRQNTPEYRQWLASQNKKKLKKRSERKNRERFLYKNIDIEQNQRKLVFGKEKGSYSFQAPLNFSFVENANETACFFDELLKFIKNRRNFGKMIFIDISKIATLTSDALMYLLAIVNNLNNKFQNKYNFSGNAPANPDVKKLFLESGFYNFVDYKSEKEIDRSDNNIQIISGEVADTETAKRIVDFVREKAKVEKHKCNFLYIMMIELMSNTHKHAYADTNTILPKWYCFANYNKKDTISFTFMDTGMGIPTTVQKRFFEHLDLLKLEASYVVSALKGEFRTATKQENRGKGLPKIKDFCKDNKIKNLHIISNKADVSVDGVVINYFDNKCPLPGTLYYWEIKFDDLRGEV